MKELTGINEDGLYEIANLISSKSNELDLIRNKIKNLVTDSNSYFKSQAGNTFRNQFNLLDENFTKIKDNLNSYSSQLRLLINKQKDFDQEMNKLVLSHEIREKDWRR